MSPPRFLVLAVLAFVILGTCLLKLPFAATTPITWVDALFTTTSAFTLTGLGVVDTGTTFTLFGQLVLLGLIEISGLGIMSFAVLVFIMLGKKIGLQNRILLQQSLNQTSVGGIVRLARSIFVFAIVTQGIAFLVLCLTWVPQYGWQKGMYFSFFHTISAFNNAGFSVWPDNLMRHAGNPVVNLVITSLIIIGGLGFTVVLEVWRKRSFSKLSLHSKLMLTATLAVNVLATLIIFGLEFHGKAVAHLGTFDQWMAAYFQAITTRTAGFNTVDMGLLTEPTLLFMVLLMFIGAGSASTGGGIKLTTFLVMLFGVVKYLREEEDIVLFRKSIKDSTIVKALAIALVSLVFVCVTVLALSVIEHAPVLTCLVEIVSAFGTVGLTRNFSPGMSDAGKLLVTFMMFFGKVGPLTLMFTLAKKGQTRIKYPAEDVLTG